MKRQEMLIGKFELTPKVDYRGRCLSFIAPLKYITVQERIPRALVDPTRALESQRKSSLKTEIKCERFLIITSPSSP